MNPESSITHTLDVIRRGTDTIKSALTLALNTIERVDRLVTSVGADSRQVARDAIRFWAALSASAEHLRTTARATPRVTAVLTELGRLAAVYRFAWVKAGFMSQDSAERYLTTVHGREGQRVRRFCERHGGGLLKLGQILSTRGDLLPAPFVDALSGLQDAAEPPPRPAIEAALDRWLPQWRDHLTLDEPLAAASLAVVYRGHLADGTPVAVKIQRPEIEQVIADDRAALALLGRLVGDAGLEGLDVRPILAEVAQSLGEEVDFAAEHDMANRFGTAIPPALCRVPATYLARHERLLVMELVDGHRLPDALRAPDTDVATLLHDLAHTFAHTMLVHGLVHGDPHPGNVLALADTNGPRLALLDFGSALVLTETQRKAYLALLVGLLGRQRGPLVGALTDLGFTTQDEPASREDLEALADALIAMPRPADLSSIDPRAELERALELMRSHRHLTMPGHMVRIGRALGTLGGLFLTHRAALAELDLGRLLMGVILEASRSAS